MSGKKTLILGASENPERYAYMAAHRLVKHGHSIINVGIKEGTVAGVPIDTQRTIYPDVHTVTVYISPDKQDQWADYLLALKPKRIIFNPGAENPDLEQLAQQNGIETLEACTLVMLGAGLY